MLELADESKRVVVQVLERSVRGLAGRTHHGAERLTASLRVFDADHSEVFNLFSHNKEAREIDRALQALIDARRLERATIRDHRKDRTLTVWRPATKLAATGT